MRKLILRMEISFDGVAAGEKGPIDGVDYSDDDSWRDIFATVQNVDAMLIGAHTAAEYLNYWHTTLTNSAASENEHKFAAIAERTPHYISFSHSHEGRVVECNVVVWWCRGYRSFEAAERTRHSHVGWADRRGSGNRGRPD